MVEKDYSNKQLLTGLSIIGIILISSILVGKSYLDNKLKKMDIKMNVQDSLNKDFYYSLVDSNEKTSFLVTATTYNQTGLTVASQFRLDPKLNYVALSRDLLEEFAYGEHVMLENVGCYNGEYIIADCMNVRFVRRIDILIKRQQKHFLFETAIIRRKKKTQK